LYPIILYTCCQSAPLAGEAKKAINSILGAVIAHLWFIRLLSQSGHYM
jgi:hypothetical protein